MSTSEKSDCRVVRFRLYPQTKANADKLFGLAGARRFTWNWAVAKLKGDYEYYAQLPSTGSLFTRIRRQTHS